MSDGKPTSEPIDPKDPVEMPEPKKGGFGAFREQYRARWEANHPETGKPKRGAYTQSSTPPPLDDVEPDPTPAPKREAETDGNDAHTDPL
jgi:hypothetical protein